MAVIKIVSFPATVSLIFLPFDCTEQGPDPPIPEEEAAVVGPVVQKLCQFEILTENTDGTTKTLVYP